METADDLQVANASSCSQRVFGSQSWTVSSPKLSPSSKPSTTNTNESLWGLQTLQQALLVLPEVVVAGELEEEAEADAGEKPTKTARMRWRPT